jgi:Uma2 family endonuclease
MVSFRPNSQKVISVDGRSLQADPARSSQESLSTAGLSTMYDLPSDDPEEPGLPDEYHDLQPQLLSQTLRLSQYARRERFTGSDLHLYYEPQHPQWYKRPDWFLAVGVSRMYAGEDLRRSYVVWQEGKVPQVVVEFLSPGTAAEDLGRFADRASQVDCGEPEGMSGVGAYRDDLTLKTDENNEEESVQRTRKPPRKFEVYEQYLKVPHYIVYSRYTQRLRYFQWVEGTYQERSLRPENPLIWLEDLEIGLGIWSGEFDDAEWDWLRWCDRDGNWLLTDTEEERQSKELERRAKESERRAKEEERQAKEQAEAQVLQAARNLLGTGMDLLQVTQVLNLSQVQVDALRSNP